MTSILNFQRVYLSYFPLTIVKSLLFFELWKNSNIFATIFLKPNIHLDFIITILFKGNHLYRIFKVVFLQLLLDLPEVISGDTKYLPDDHRCGVLPRYTLVGYSPKPADLNNQSSYLSGLFKLFSFNYKKNTLSDTYGI